MALLKSFQFVLCIALMAFVSLSAADTAPPSKEHQIEAVFLFHFAEFVEWPANAFSDPNQPFVIGILGNDPFGSYLDEVVRGEKIKGRSIIVKRFDKVEDVIGCQILFLSQLSGGIMELVFAGVKNKPILTVSGTESFCQFGCMICFGALESKLMTINNEAAKAVHLEISYKLLKLAEVLPAAKG